MMDKTIIAIEDIILIHLLKNMFFVKNIKTAGTKGKSIKRHKRVITSFLLTLALANVILNIKILIFYIYNLIL